MLNKTKIIKYLKEHKQYFYKKYGIKIIGLFGSYANNTYNANSDIDILYSIEKNIKLSIFKYLQIIQDLEKVFKKRIDLVRYEKIKPTIKEYIIKNAIFV